MTTVNIKKGDNIGEILDKLWDIVDVESGPPILIFEEGTHVVGEMKIKGNINIVGNNFNPKSLDSISNGNYEHNYTVLQGYFDVSSLRSYNIVKLSNLYWARKPKDPILEVDSDKYKVIMDNVEIFCYKVLEV